MSVGGSWDDDNFEERLRFDEPPTQGGSSTRETKSHRSLNGLDHSSDKAHAFSMIVVWSAVIGVGAALTIGAFGGLIYLVRLIFG